MLTARGNSTSKNPSRGGKMYQVKTEINLKIEHLRGADLPRKKEEP